MREKSRGNIRYSDIGVYQEHNLHVTLKPTIQGHLTQTHNPHTHNPHKNIAFTHTVFTHTHTKPSHDTILTHIQPSHTQPSHTHNTHTQYKETSGRVLGRQKAGSSVPAKPADRSRQVCELRASETDPV